MIADAGIGIGEVLVTIGLLIFILRRSGAGIPRGMRTVSFGVFLIAVGDAGWGGNLLVTGDYLFSFGCLSAAAGAAAIIAAVWRMSDIESDDPDLSGDDLDTSGQPLS
jgi:hypothetical protein